MTAQRAAAAMALANLAGALLWLRARGSSLPPEAAWGLVGFWASANAAVWMFARVSRDARRARLGRLAGRNRSLLVSEFLSYSLFQIREYLSSITSVSERLALALSDPGAVELVGRLKQTVAECNGKVSRMMESVQANSTTRRPPDRYEVSELVEECLDAARTACPAPLARARVSCADAGEATGDREAAACALTSVIANALEAVSARPLGGRVDVRARRGEPFVEIEVVDEGGGIPAEDLPHVFTPLFSRKSGGVGLGLSMSRRLVERAGGTLNLRSEGKRTSVRIQLPTGPALPYVRDDATWPRRRGRA